MFKKLVLSKVEGISLVTFVLLVAISATACGQLQLPSSLPQLPTDTQPSVAPAPAANNAPDQSAQTAPPAPGAGPQAQGKGNQGGNRAAALFQMLNRLGWEGGVVTKISSDQITLRTIERPGLEVNPRQNQPGTNPPAQKRPDLGRVETVNVNSSTIIIVPGKPNATLNDLRVGDRVIADVPNGQKFAALIMGTPKQLDKDNVTLGMVTSNTNGTLTLRAPGGGDTVSTTSTTQVFKLAKDGVTPGAVSDLQNGNLVIALGNGSDDNFTAQVIFTLPKGALNLGKDGKKNPPPAPNPGG